MCRASSVQPWSFTPMCWGCRCPAAKASRVSNPPREGSPVRGPVRLPLEQLQPYLFEVPEVAIPGADAPRLAWGSIFGNQAPVEIEVGFGKGLFLLTASQERPEVNFFGIEIERKYQLSTANRIAKRHLHNVRLACTDARLFLRDWVEPGSVTAVHVYFPDPWWKKRHHKRRLFTAEFAAACAK